MSGFLGIGGSSSKTDRSQYLGGQGALSNIFNTAIPSGASDTGAAEGFNKSVLSGNRSAITQALQPEIGTITGEANQAKKQQAAMGTSRGGGTNAQNQQLDKQTQAAITGTINQARPEASKQLASIGSNLLGLGENAAGQYTGNAASSYATTTANNTAAGQAAGQAAAALLFGV
jgi:hypothetical protein